MDHKDPGRGDAVADAVATILRKDRLDAGFFTSAFDPDSLIGFARRHGVVALVQHALVEGGQWQTLPGEVQDAFWRQIRRAAALELSWGRSLREFFDVLAGAGVEALLIKGAALAYSVYEKPYHRPHGDVDVLISLSDVSRVLSVCTAAGYELVGDAFRAHQFALHRKAPAGEAVFDVHWRISNAPRFARTISFEEARAAAIALPELDGVLALGPVDSLMLACMHRLGNQDHDRDRLIWLYDIHLLLSALSTDAVRELVALAGRRGISDACRDGILAARERFHTAVDADTLAGLAAGSVPSSLSARFGGTYLGLVIDDMVHLPDTRSRIGLLRELLFPEAQALLRRYGKSQNGWLPLLYVRHWLRGLVVRATDWMR